MRSSLSLGEGYGEVYYAYTDNIGSLISLMNESGTVVERYAYDPWGARRNPDNWTQADSRTSWLVNRGYAMHEHLDKFRIINMNGRLYDPIIGRFFSPDPYVVDPTGTQGFNRYSYCMNNPLMYTDPSGEFLFTLGTVIAAPFTGGSSLALLPTAIAADFGMWQGGSIANGTMNPLKWDYQSGKTWGYMLGGAAVGGLSGFVGSAIATSGIPFANTLGIAGGSFTNSLGTWAYTGGQTPISISLGVASYDFTNGTFGYLGKKGNSVLENIGYGLGAMANLADLGKAGDLLLNTEKKDIINHSAILDENGNTIISEGPGKNWIEPKGTVDHYLNRFLGGSGATNEYPVHGENMIIKNVNVTTIKNYGKILDFLTRRGKGVVPYSFLYSSCSTHTGLALNLAGIPTLFLHPYTVQASVWLWNAGITPALINNSYHLQNYR